MTDLDHASDDPREDELSQALARLDAVLARVRRDAGAGHCPEHERSLAAPLRTLRALGGADTGEIAHDLVDAARRVLEAADPDAPLRVLEMSRRSLGAAVRRPPLSRRDAA